MFGWDNLYQCLGAERGCFFLYYAVQHWSVVRLGCLLNFVAFVILRTCMFFDKLKGGIVYERAIASTDHTETRQN